MKKVIKTTFTEQSARDLLNAYYHAKARVSGLHYRGWWGYANCALDPDEQGRIYMQTWVIGYLAMIIKDRQIYDDTITTDKDGRVIRNKAVI